MMIFQDIEKESQVTLTITRNNESIELEKPELQDLDIIYELVQNHFTHTNSEIAKQILSNWELSTRKFIKVMPIEYKRALEKLAEEKINQIIN